MSTAVKIRTPQESAIETTHLVLPPDTNVHGTAFGGKVMQWMDVAAGICAGRHSRKPVVTAAVDELVFNHPIRMGDIVIIKACVNYTGRTSMEIGVRVEREDATSRSLEHCLSGYFTFVAIDTEGQPVEVPAVSPTNETEQRRFDTAKARRQRRLERRS